MIGGGEGTKRGAKRISFAGPVVGWFPVARCGAAWLLDPRSSFQCGGTRSRIVGWLRVVASPDWPKRNWSWMRGCEPTVKGKREGD